MEPEEAAMCRPSAGKVAMAAALRRAAAGHGVGKEANRTTPAVG